MKTIVVTGGTGFIGKVVVSNLLEKGYQVKVLTRNPYASIQPHKNLTFVTGDVTNLKSLSKAFNGADVIVHSAVNKYDKNLAYKVNVLGAKNVIAAMRKNNVSRVINISTQSAKLKKDTLYGTTKAQSDELFAQSGLDFTTLRISIIYGDDPNSLFQKIVNYVDKLPVIPVLGDGTVVSYPIYVGDFGEIVPRVINTKETIGKAYDVGGTKGYTFNQLIMAIAKYKKKKKTIVHIPYSVSFAAALTAERLLTNPPVNKDNIIGMNTHHPCNPMPLLKTIAYTPLSLKDGLMQVFNNPQKKKVAIIGLGKMGTLHGAILSVLKHQYNFEIVALVDQNKSLATTASSMGLSGVFYKDIDTMLKEQSIDIAFVITPTFNHKEIAEKLIKKGINVFIEKPLTTNNKDTKALYALSKEKGVTCGVGYFYSYRPTFMTFTQLAHLVKSEISSFNVRVEHGDVLVRGKKGWVFNKKISGGGVLMNPASHALALIIHLFGNPTRIQATTNQLYSTTVEDEATIHFSYNDPILEGDLSASWSVPNKPLLETTFTILGQFGTITATETKLKLNLTKNIAGTSFKKGTKLLSEDDLLKGNDKDVFYISKGAGGVGYYLQDKAFIDAAINQHPFENNFKLAVNIENTIAKAYNIAKTA